MTDGILITTKKTEMKKNNLIWGLGLLMGIFAGCSDGVDTIDIKKVLAQEQKNI